MGPESRRAFLQSRSQIKPWQTGRRLYQQTRGGFRRRPVRVRQGTRRRGRHLAAAVADRYLRRPLDYDRNVQYKTPKRVIDMLVDVVSRNGNLLLNFPLNTHGSLDAEEQKILAA